MNGVITILISNTANKQAKKKNTFHFLFVEMLHKFKNEKISKKRAMMHIWIVSKTRLKRSNRRPVQREKQGISHSSFAPFSFTQQNRYERNKHFVEWFEKAELFSCQLLRKKDTEPVFTVFRLRTTPFLFSLVPLFLLIYCFPFHSKNNAIYQEEWMLFQSVMKRKYFTKKEAEFPHLEQDYVFFFFLYYQAHFFSFLSHIHR